MVTAWPEAGVAATTRFRSRGLRHLDAIAARYGLPDEVAEAARLVARVLPFRVNDYVLEHLVDWDHVPHDPIFQMTFPQRDMLSADQRARLGRLRDSGASDAAEDAEIRRIRAELNPHPSGQRELNVPMLDGERLPGLQHKYERTLLYFPAQGQTCHSYCTYCFRWAQFVGQPELRFAAAGPATTVRYLHARPEITDVLITGGDPMVMSTERLTGHLEPLLDVGTVETIRIGTKSVAYWPHRFVTDDDADDLLRLFARVVASGRTLAVIAHVSHPRELSTDVARRAMGRIRETGAVVFCQAPLIARVNDRAETWGRMWRAELATGAVPYYMFVERDTGPHDYFKVPLRDAVRIFRQAYRDAPGLVRTVRGPVMSATAGKVVVDDARDDARGRCVFALRMLQARDPELVGRPFTAVGDADAAWLDDLVPDPDTPADIAAALRPAPSGAPLPLPFPSVPVRTEPVEGAP